MEPQGLFIPFPLPHQVPCVRHVKPTTPSSHLHLFHHSFIHSFTHSSPLGAMEALTTIWSTLKVYQGPLLTLAFLFGPSLYKRVLVLFHTPPDVSSPPRSRTLLLVLALQAFYTIYTLLKPPYNAFAHYDLLTPTDILRPLILSDFGLDGWNSDPLVELFLARLGSVDGRMAYSRWGHVAFFGCAWCRSKADYALSALPGILGPYVAEALLLGALGWTSVGGEGARERSKKWRPTMGWAVAAMAVGEFAIRWWFDLRVREGALLHVSRAEEGEEGRKREGGVGSEGRKGKENNAGPLSPSLVSSPPIQSLLPPSLRLSSLPCLPFSLTHSFPSPC